ALAACINCETMHYARSVRAGPATKPAGDLDAMLAPQVVAAELFDADVVIVHNGVVDRAHRHLIANKPIVTVVDGSTVGVNWEFVRDGEPAGVLSHAADRL